MAGVRRGGAVKIALLPGDGIGPEIVAEAAKLLERCAATGCRSRPRPRRSAARATTPRGSRCRRRRSQLAQAADAVLMGAVGGPRYDTLPRELRPEQGILAIRKALGLFANLRPALLYPELAAASTLKPEVVAGLDLMIVRELTGDIYFGAPRGRRVERGRRRRKASTRCSTANPEIRRIARVGFETARKRGARSSARSTRPTCSTRRSCGARWSSAIGGGLSGRRAVAHVCRQRGDAAGAQSPKQFDVIVTGNLFGDILSDEASMLAGSIGMLPSASLDASGKGLYEPIHGSAPDIAGQDKANPLATILSLAMMFRYTFARADVAERIEAAVRARARARACAPRDIALPRRARGRHARHGRRRGRRAVSGS